MVILSAEEHGCTLQGYSYRAWHGERIDGRGGVAGQSALSHGTRNLVGTRDDVETGVVIDGAAAWPSRIRLLCADNTHSRIPLDLLRHV
jgi:hypothetical protein